MKKVRINSASIVPIVKDGAIGDPSFGDGRIIPVLVIDCSRIPELKDLIYAHENLPPGDVETVWGGRRFRKKSVFLIIKFYRPAELEVILEFDTLNQGSLVDGILHSNAVYLQPLESGSTVFKGITKGKILVEVAGTDFIAKWTNMFNERLTKKFKKNGLGKKQAKNAAREHLQKLREMWAIRYR